MNSIHFLESFCLSNKKKSDGKKLTPTQHLPNISCGTLPTTILTLIRTDNVWSTIELQDICGSKYTLSGPIKYRTLNSSSKIAEWKHTLMHKCTISQPQSFLSVFLSARSGSTCYHNALLNKISSDRNSQYTDGLMHSVIAAEGLNFSQLKDSDTQIHTINCYIAEIYLFLIHWWGWYAILLLSWGIHCLITLLSYTQHYYVFAVHSTILHCWATPNPNTLLR